MTSAIGVVHYVKYIDDRLELPIYLIFLPNENLNSMITIIIKLSINIIKIIKTEHTMEMF